MFAALPAKMVTSSRVPFRFSDGLGLAINWRRLEGQKVNLLNAVSRNTPDPGGARDGNEYHAARTTHKYIDFVQVVCPCGLRRRQTATGR